MPVNRPTTLDEPGPSVLGRERKRRKFMDRQTKGGLSLSAPATLYVLVLILAPMGLTLVYSFWSQPFLHIVHNFTLLNYSRILSDPIYLALIIRSLVIAGTATMATVILAYPIAYFIAFRGGSHKALLLLLVTVPFWTSYLLRVFSWKIILGYHGVLNSALNWLGIIDEPITALMYNANAVVITLIHAWAPFAILPIFVSLEKIDRSLLEAATDLGDGPLRRFFRVTLPLSMPGVIGASLLVFMPTIGDYITPALVGGDDGMMVANLIEAQFGIMNDWPMGAALAIATMICAVVVALGWVAILRLATRRIR